MAMHLFLHRIMAARPHKPRNPFVKALLSVFGLFLLFGVCVFAIVAGVVMLVASFVLKRLGRKPARQTDVLEGEYRVVRPSRITLP